VLLSACGFLGKTPPPEPPRHTSMGLSITSLELRNKLRVVLVRDARASEVQVTMRYQVGANDDPEGQEGVAHLVEHLMFQQVLGGQSLFAKLQSFATFFNAATSWDATTYVSRAKASHLDEMLSIEAVRVGFRCTSVTDTVFARERAVVVNEIAMRGKGNELLETIQDGLYPVGHPYRHRIGGTSASVGAITREQACAFADAHYAPENAVLVVSGNISPQTLEGALGKFIAKVAKRDGANPVPVPVVTPTGTAVKVPAPVDDERLIIAWPLPSDLAERAKLMAIAPLLLAAIDGQIKGSAQRYEFGDGRAPMLGISITLGDDETLDQATKGVKDALGGLPLIFRTLGRVDLGEAVFEQLRQQAIYKAYANLDDTLQRDADLASYVLAGMEPAEAVGQPFAGLREMNRNEASRVAEEVLRFDRASVVVLHPRTEKKTGREEKPAVALHDIGQHRDPPDPAEASKPAQGEVPVTTLPAMTTRVLPNGLKVVLLPVTSVPTVDIRLIFNAGMADDLPSKRGAAVVAGHALTWDSRFLNDYLVFAAAGGSDTMSVGEDITVFTVQGLDMHVDVLLAGLRRWVRDGRYRKGDETVRDALRAEQRLRSDLGPITDAWTSAVYGDQHPYVRAGLVRHASPGLTVDDAREFRRAHFTPDNATLVISGRFDGPLADRWVDFLFGDWKGKAAPRGNVRATPSVASLAREADTTQVGLAVAIPARNGSRAQQLVAAVMLDEIAEDIRHQLGASYALGASLGEDRLATNYFIAGTLDAGRTRDAIELVRTRLERLAHEPATAASAFVAARTRVIAQLSASEGTAGQIASRVETDVKLGRPPLSDLATAAEVHALTIESMATTLADLDLSHATIQMTGPTVDVDAAFTALGRKPESFVRAIDDENPLRTIDTTREAETFSLSDLAEPLTGQPPSTRLRLTAVPFSLATGKVLDHGVSGYAFAIGGEFRLDRTTSVGLLGSIGYLDGTYETDDLIAQRIPISVLPISISASLGSSAYDRVWGRFSVGFHANQVTDGDEESGWDKGIGIGLQGGVDILKLGRHRAGLVAAFETDLFTTASTYHLSLGVAYRY
jgi:zinc protease